MLNQNYRNIIEKAKATVAVVEKTIHIKESQINRDESILIMDNKELDTETLIRQLFAETLKVKKAEMKILENIVNSGLEYTYPHKQLEFKIEFVEKNNRVVPEFYLNSLLLKPPFKGDGGGIISSVSLLMYIAKIKLTKRKVILRDEVESMVDLNASKRLFRFLKEFAVRNNILIVCITHKQLDYSYSNISDKIKVLKLED